MQTKGNVVSILLALLLSLGALALYTTTLSQGPYPGQPAEMMATELGLIPIAIGQHPLFSAVVKVVNALPVGTLTGRLNFLSAVCAAVALWFFFGIVRRAILFAIDVTDLNRRAANAAAVLAAVAATVALALCSPFWYAANRFHVAAFDLLLLFALARLFLSFVHDAALWKAMLFAVAYGIVAVEFATVIVFGPLVLAGLLAVLWHHGELTRARILALAGCLLLGMSFYFAAAWRLASSPAFELHESGGFWKALYFYLRGQFNLIARSLPQVGWLLVVVTGVIPWLAALAVGRRSLNEEKDKGLYVLHVILTAVSLAVLFDVPFMPWRLLGEAQLLVTPYVLLAATYGYLVAYWFLLPRMFALDAEPDERGRIWFRENGGWIPALALILIALTAGVLHFRESDARPAGAVNAYARAVLQTATEVAGSARDAAQDTARYGSGPWIVTDGLLDNHLLIAAAETGKPLFIFNLRMVNNGPYLRSIANLFQDTRLRSLAGLDGITFLRAWMTDDPDFSKKTVFQVHPDLWYAGGFQPVPNRMLYVGVKGLGDVAPETVWQASEALWNGPVMRELQRVKMIEQTTVGRLVSYLLRQVSMAANNLGVVMEDIGWRQQGYAAYAKSRELDQNNISALLNMGTMLDQGFSATNSAEIRSAIRELLSGLKQKLRVWDLARVYGYVRMPQAYADLGMTWALSGQPGMAVAGFKRAIELDPTQKAQLTHGLAKAYLAQDQKKEGEALYRQALEQDSSNRVALVAMARLSAGKGQFERAREFLQRAEAAGVPRETIAMEYAVVHLAAGDSDKARVILEGVTDLDSEITQAWAMLAAVAVLHKDEVLIQRCVRKLERVKNKNFLVFAVLGDIALYRADFTTARTYFDQALIITPNALPLLELLLRLDYQERRRDLALVHIKAILLKDPGHAFANQLLASFQIEREEFDLAEDSLRRAIERGKTPSLLNDLAWALQGQGKTEAAERTVREALATTQEDPSVWDTLGVILMKQGKLAEAEEALLKSRTLAPGDTAAQIHLAQLHEKKGDHTRAVKMAEELLTRESELSEKERKTLRNIARNK